MPDAVYQARASRSDHVKTRVAWLAIGILSGAVAVGGAWRLLSPSRAPQVTAPLSSAEPGALTIPALAAPASQASPQATTAPSKPEAPLGNAAGRDAALTPPVAVPVVPEHKPVEIVQQPGPARTAGEKINLNTATAEQIALLPGIGPKLAASIVADREKNGKFKRVADLDRVKGIGRKKLDAIRSSVLVD